MSSETTRPAEDSSNEQPKRTLGRSLPNILNDGQFVMIFGGKRPSIVGNAPDSAPVDSKSATNNIGGTDDESADRADTCASE